MEAIKTTGRILAILTACTFQWLPMIFAFPFNMPNKVGVEVRKNIYRNLILRMQEDGLLPKAGNLTKTGNLKISFEIAHTERDKMIVQVSSML